MFDVWCGCRMFWVVACGVAVVAVVAGVGVVKSMIDIAIAMKIPRSFVSKLFVKIVFRNTRGGGESWLLVHLLWYCIVL